MKASNTELILGGMPLHAFLKLGQEFVIISLFSNYITQCKNVNAIIK
jgi:hypothetical protein